MNEILEYIRKSLKKRNRYLSVCFFPRLFFIAALTCLFESFNFALSKKVRELEFSNMLEGSYLRRYLNQLKSLLFKLNKQTYDCISVLAVHEMLNIFHVFLVVDSIKKVQPIFKLISWVLRHFKRCHGWIVEKRLLGRVNDA